MPLARILLSNVFKIPESVPFDIAALLEPLNVAYQCVLRSSPSPRHKIVIFGAGPIGLATLACLVQKGFKDVAICDLSDYCLKLARHNSELGQYSMLETLTFGSHSRNCTGRLSILDNLLPIWDMDLFIEASGAPIIEDLINKAKFGARITFVAAS